MNETVKRRNNRAPVRRPSVDGTHAPVVARTVDAHGVESSMKMTYIDRNIVIASSFKNAWETSLIWANDADDLDKKNAAEYAVIQNKVSSRTIIGVGIVSIFVTFFLSAVFTLWFLLGIIPAIVLPFFLAKAMMRVIYPRLEMNDCIEFLPDSSPNHNIVKLLTSQESPLKLSTVIRRKLLTVGDRYADVQEFQDWLNIVNKIYTFDKEYDPELIPMLRKDASVVVKSLEEESKHEYARNRADFMSKKEIEQKTLDHRRKFVEKQVSDDSSNVLEIAMHRFKVLKQLDGSSELDGLE